MTTERFANDVQTTLASGVDDTTPSISVVTSAGFPPSPQYRIRVDDELMLVTAGAGTNSWTVMRGIENTARSAHDSGADVVHVLTAGALGVTSDPDAAVAGLRTLGTAATQAASGAHTHPASAIVSGIVAPDRLGSGTASGSTFLRGDQTWVTPAGGPGDIPQSVLEVYVDYVNGSDSNTGLSRATAYKTIQAAYNALKTYALANYTPDSNGRFGVGRIYLAPGDHQVGAGLTFDNRYAVEILGTRSGRANHDMPNTSSRIVSTSTTATEMVRISSGTGVIGLGFVFNNVVFRVDDTAVTGNVALTKVIWVTSVGHLRVERCSFGTVGNSANLAVTAIYHEDITTSSGEAGWVRVIANNCSRMQLYKATTTTGAAGGNFNRGRIRDNVILYGHATMPMIHLNADTNGYLVDNNNLEGTATGLELSTGAFTTNTFLNNAGEDPSTGTPPNPFYKVSGSCSGQLFIGGVCTTGGASGAGTWINFAHANAYNNLVIGPYDANGVTTAKRKIVDSSTANGNVLLHTNHRIASKYKSGAGVINLADSDFTTGPPPNGTTGVVHNTTTGNSYLCARANGTWKAVQVT